MGPSREVDLPGRGRGGHLPGDSGGGGPSKGLEGVVSIGPVEMEPRKDGTFHHQCVD